MTRIGKLLALAALSLLAGVSYGQEVGNYPNATTPLNGTERLLGDQSASGYPCTGCTVNITPAQIVGYFTSGSFTLDDCIEVASISPLKFADAGLACGSGSMTWPAAAGIANYSGSSSWDASYNASNPIPANFLASTVADLDTANAWTALQTFQVGITLSNAEPISFQNSSGSADSTITESSSGDVAWYIGSAHSWVLYTSDDSPLLDYGITHSGAFTNSQPLYLTGIGSGTLASCLGLTSADLVATGSCGSGSMVYPGAGIPVSTGSAWSTSITPGTGVATALGVNVGSAGAVVVNGGALGTPSSGVATNLTGTANGLNIGGNAANLSGTPALPNGTTATTQTSGDNTTKLATDAFVIANASSGGVSSAAAGSGIVISGTGSGPYTGAITIGTNAANRTVTISPTVASTDMGGQIVMNVSGGGTLTIPAISSTVFAAGLSLSVVNYSASTAAVSTTPTVNAGGGCVTATGIPSGDSWQILSNGTTLDCIQTVSAGGGGGGSPGGSTNSVQTNNGSGGFNGISLGAGQILQGNSGAPTATSTPTLGSSGTLGSLTFGNATSGTLTLEPTTGALGAVIVSMPAHTGTLSETDLAQTWSAAQSFDANGILLAGSGTGYTTLSSANSSSTGYIWTIPAATDTAVGVAATQTLTNKSIAAGEVNSGTFAAAQMPAFTGDMISTGGTVATTVVKVNGAAVPTSAAVLSSNSGGQLTSATTVTYLIDVGTTFTLGTGTGACATTSTLTGGAATGSFKCTGTAGASTQVINLPTAVNGWQCSASDSTSGVAWANEIASTSTGKIAGTVTTAGDVITFSCTGY